jgi:acyl carrier protein phosphodiesterase|tara:strand:+ start:5585 stop:6238 length:654 start_codon:yes stop_codon:yes gene_type:complete
VNFLAHCALAADAAKVWGRDDDFKNGLLAGAILADFKKGTISAELPASLRLGIQLHRRIDAVSNGEPAIRESLAAFPAPYRRFAPIFVDILADHYLSQTWHEFYSTDIEHFAARCCLAGEEFAAFRPAGTESFFHYLAETHLLAQYHQWSTVERGFKSVLRRLGKEQWLDAVCELAVKQQGAGLAYFRLYFPSIRAQLANWTDLANSREIAFESRTV